MPSVNSCTGSPFLDLPKELRQMIIKYRVAQGKVFPYPKPAMDPRYKGWKEYGTPTFQLLRVSRQIAEDTKEMYHLHNLAVIPRGMECWLELDVDSIRSSIRPCPHTWTIPPFRALSITFGNSDMSVAKRLKYERLSRKDFEKN